MSGGPEPGYSRTQGAPWCLLLYSLGVVFLAASWAARDVPAVPVVLAAAGLLTAVPGASFHRLTVEDEGDRLAVRFGPLPLFRRRIRYADIRSAEVGRTPLLHGWGIHYGVRGGWVWTISGRECVALRLRHGGVLRVGTDDAENLARFLRGKITTCLVA